MNQLFVAAIIGPTAVGKTSVALKVAEALDIEIISADSMQVYRGMDIGTAKVSKSERARVPHHLIDIREPDEIYNVAQFQSDATELIAAIHGRGRVPVIVGGTGLYIDALLKGYDLDGPGPDNERRDELYALADREGSDVIYERLKSLDPAAAAEIHPNDHRRIVRAIEYMERTGESITEQGTGQQRPFRDVQIGLRRERERLYQRINQRVDIMVDNGLLDEVRQLLDAGYDPDLPSLQGLNYRQCVAHLLQGVSWDETIRLMKRDTRHFAKRQLSWFRRNEQIHWLNPDNRDCLPKIVELTAGKLRQ